MLYTWTDITDPQWQNGEFGNTERMLSSAEHSVFTLEVWENIESPGEPPTLQWQIRITEEPRWEVQDCSGVGEHATLELNKLYAEQALQEHLP